MTTSRAEPRHEALAAGRAPWRAPSLPDRWLPLLFLIPALLLVLLDSVLSTRRGRTRRAPAAATATALALMLLLVPLTLRAETGDAADKLYEAGRYPEAAAAYQREIQEHTDSPRLEYNLGTALMHAWQLEDAVAAL